MTIPKVTVHPISIVYAIKRKRSELPTGQSLVNGPLPSRRYQTVLEGTNAAVQLARRKGNLLAEPP